ncbi:YicC family protein [Pectobacterium parmentieri]|uniref:YicC/YloC family endoribonuclease n=1 Tax=Pectobacterium parmentieri TaxID=1905730 RepID=UPI0001B0C83C|nr:YicC/YloC family endoribonuclease [Pectobacterium parmentieri]ACX90097.1 YicC domain protein [Pectobacterium parmentieri WPP163]AYH03479.1 YicC family protein [Pectobacterium parmentieri]AYH07814.1 YicC family protein [Pectobacterium parmentieri]AYH29736.1 YicC family protein [Pectobacterium parmentieri]AYH34154.1 YicC family protein [Pectobacterium parmentieri]
MIRSMTAYARREIKGNWGSAAWELRSVNQRYLETYLRLPEQFRSLEPVARERIRARLTRGKIECNLRFELDPSAQSALILNEKLAKQLVNAANWVKMQSGEGEINPVDILRWPGVMSAEEQDLDAISTELLKALEGALDDFIAARESEGNALKALIEQRLAGVSAEVIKVRAQMPNVLLWQRERLQSKLEDAQVQLENNRLEQELVLMAQRVDVAEELDRLDAHVKETYKILKKEEAVGRRLDFMMQEFNRESNTLASKSINADVTASAIELKVLIEQMREQIQNIE